MRLPSYLQLPFIRRATTSVQMLTSIGYGSKYKLNIFDHWLWLHITLARGTIRNREIYARSMIGDGINFHLFLKADAVVYSFHVLNVECSQNDDVEKHEGHGTYYVAEMY